MQRPNSNSAYYDDFIDFQQKLCAKIIVLRKDRNLVQEDMADYELSVRQYQRMEQDYRATVSLWQVFKIAKGHDMEIHQLLDV